jgi:two-component system chemotaxis sensor kinase CheA
MEAKKLSVPHRLDEIGEPLIHLLRNSIDHGIETPAKGKRPQRPCGTIKLSAQRNGDHVHNCGGRRRIGIDPEKIKNPPSKKGSQLKPT